MLRLKITGRKPKVAKKLIVQAVNYALPLLMSQRLIKTLKIDIELGPDVWQKHKCLAYCEGYGSPGQNPKFFKIEIDTGTTKKRFMESLMHELVHVKQYAKGELRDIDSRSLTKFRGEYYENSDHINDVMDPRYWDSPWEVEAFGKEYGLYYRFELSQKKLDKRKARK